MTALRQLLVASAIGCVWFTTAQALPYNTAGSSMPSIEVQAVHL